MSQLRICKVEILDDTCLVSKIASENHYPAIESKIVISAFDEDIPQKNTT